MWERWLRLLLTQLWDRTVDSLPYTEVVEVAADTVVGQDCGRPSLHRGGWGCCWHCCGTGLWTAFPTQRWLRLLLTLLWDRTVDSLPYRGVAEVAADTAVGQDCEVAADTVVGQDCGRPSLHRGGWGCCWHCCGTGLWTVFPTQRWLRLLLTQLWDRTVDSLPYREVAEVAADTVVGQDCEVAADTVVGQDCEVAADTVVGQDCEVAADTAVGQDCGWPSLQKGSLHWLSSSCWTCHSSHCQARSALLQPGQYSWGPKHLAMVSPSSHSGRCVEYSLTHLAMVSPSSPSGLCVEYSLTHLAMVFPSSPSGLCVEYSLTHLAMVSPSSPSGHCVEYSLTHLAMVSPSSPSGHCVEYSLTHLAMVSPSSPSGHCVEYSLTHLAMVSLSSPLPFRTLCLNSLTHLALVSPSSAPGVCVWIQSDTLGSGIPLIRSRSVCLDTIWHTWLWYPPSSAPGVCVWIQSDTLGYGITPPHPLQEHVLEYSLTDLAMVSLPPPPPHLPLQEIVLEYSLTNLSMVSPLPSPSGDCVWIKSDRLGYGIPLIPFRTLCLNSLTHLAMVSPPPIPFWSVCLNTVWHTWLWYPPQDIVFE